MWNNRRDIKIDELNTLKSFIRKAEFRIDIYCDDFKGYMWQFTDMLIIGGKQFDGNILYD